MGGMAKKKTGVHMVTKAVMKRRGMSDATATKFAKNAQRRAGRRPK